MLKLLFVTLFNLLILCASISQNIETPFQTLNRDTLFTSLRSYHTAKRNANVAEYQTADNVKWMRWIPSVGVMYNLQGQPRPSVNFSIDKIYTNIRDKDLRRAKIESLTLDIETQFKTDSINVEALLKRLDVSFQALQSLEQSHQIDKDIFTIYQRKYDANEITPIEYLTQKRQFFDRAATLERKREEIELLRIEVRKASKM